MDNISSKFCNAHQTWHTFTNEYWYDRNTWFECRLKRKEVYKKYSVNYLDRKNKLQNTRRKENPEKFKKETNKFHRTLKGRFRTLKGMAKRRNIDVFLSFDEYSKIVDSTCFYCLGKLPEAGHGLDRLDSNQGYTYENVVPCCTICNLAKHKMTFLEFKEWIRRVSKVLMEAGG